jgi:hypothetical protein
LVQTSSNRPSKSGLLKLSQTLFLLFLLNLILVVILDLMVFFQLNQSLQGIVIWEWDSNIRGDMASRFGLGYGKLFSAIVCVMAIIVLCILLPQLHNRWEEKKRTRFVTLVYFSALYLMISRVFDLFYIISASDLRGLVYSIGQFYLPLDIIATACYIAFVYEVFLLKEVSENQPFSKYLIGMTYIAAFISIATTLDIYIDNFPLFIFGIISYLVLVIIFLICIRVSLKIFALKSYVEENKHAIKIIGLQLVLFALMLISLALSIQFGGDQLVLSYIFRAIKNIIIIIIALMYYPAIIKPR